MKSTLKPVALIVPFLFIVFLVLVLICILTTAYNRSDNEDVAVISYDNFIEITDTTQFMSDTKYRIVYDKNTKVEYYYITYNGSRGVNITLCPVYNSDGSIKVYDGE